MNKISAWLQKRELLKKEAEIVDIPRSLKDLLFSVDRETKSLLKSYLRSKSDLPLEEVESFIRNPKFIDDIIKSQPSNFHKRFVEEKFLKSAKSLCESLYYLSSQDLSKAIDPEDFKNQIYAHIDENGKNIVDHKDQMNQFPAHPEYLKMLKDPRKFGSIPFEEGISAKMVHNKHGYTDKGGDFVSYTNPHTFMTKPYHPKNDEANLTTFPLHGWATMATKSLFNAGKIGHLCEDVGIHEHEGRPVTVHKFNNNADMIADMNEHHDIDPLEIHQISVMDYLANNLDRHAGNLMVHKDKSGNSHLLGIDHERNYAYEKQNFLETPFEYSKSIGLSKAKRHSDMNAKGAPLIDWWKKNGMNIQKEFAKQTGSIQDPAIRKHVYDNFMGRWERMDDWAKNANRNASYRDFHNDNTFEGAPLKEFKQPINKKILASLPKNPRDAVSALYDVANRKDKLNHTQSGQIKEVLSNLIKRMNPEEIAQVYKTSLDNPNWEVRGSKSIPNIRSIILDHLNKPEEYHENKPLYKLNHIKAIADTIDALPEDHLKGLIQKQQAKKLRNLISKVTRKAA